MPIEMLKDPITSLGGNFGNITSKPGEIGKDGKATGEVSVWAVADGAPEGGFYSKAQLEQQGIPFGYGDRRVVKGFRIGKTKDENGKDVPNTQIGPSGRKYVEMIVDAKSMHERAQFHAEVSRNRESTEKKDAEAAKSTEAHIERTNQLHEQVARQQLVDVAAT